MNHRWQTVATRVAVVYALASLLWIATSDLLLGELSRSLTGYTLGSMTKGFLFVLLTSALLYSVSRRILRTEFEARQRAEEVARQLQDLESIVRQSGELLYKRDTHHRLVYVSPQHQSVLGYTPEELKTDWTKFLTDNPINRTAIDLTEQAIRTGQRQRTHLVEIRKKNGAPLWLEVDESPLKDSQDQVVGVVGAARDVTERERAQRALQESEKKFRQLAETITEVFWIANVDLTQVLYVSPAYEQVWGRSCSSLYENPKSWAEAIFPEDRPQADELLDQTRASKEVMLEYRIRRPDGGMRWILDRGFPLRDETGKVAGMVGVARDITKRKVVEEALRESEEKLRTLYTTMNEGLALHEIVYDENGQAADYRILDINPAYESITGLKRGAVMGALASVAYGTGEAPYLDTYAKVAASGQATTFETFFQPLNKHFTVSVFSPRPGRFAITFSDITQRKEAERQILLLNQVYALVSQINEAIVRISDRDTLFRETCRITVEQGHFAMVWIGVVDEETRDVRPACWAGREDGYLQRIKISSAEVPHGRGPVGTAIRERRVVTCADIAVDPAMAPWREAALARGFRSLIALPLKVGGNCIGAFAVYAGEPNVFSAVITESLIEVAADISFALELFERNRQREAEQQQLRLQHSALEAAASAIAITDRQGVIQWVNFAFTRLTGYTREEAIGQNPRLVKSGAHPPSFYQRMWATILEGAVWQGEITNRRKDGTHYPEEMTITPVRSEAGEITHFIAIKQDVTERKKLEHQFLRAQRMQSIGLLAGGVAHDLNNVLAPVMMALPLLRQPTSAEERDRLLDTLEQNIKRGANIVQQVLTFARGVEVQRVLVQLRHLAREVTRIAEETFPRDIQTTMRLPAGLWPLLGDPTQIHQVLLNLAVNARDAMPEGGQLTFTGRNVQLQQTRQFLDFEIPPGRYVCISVADTGTGIAPEILERIFEPFFTTKPAGKGTGLGLSTVLGIVKSHGGLVEVQTRLGAGSTFTIYLPASPPDTLAEGGVESLATRRGQGETILVVDDEASILQTTRSTLQANGYRVLTARHGMEAMSLLSENRATVRVVVTDIMMPVMDGLALTQAIRQRDPELPVIAATGLLNPPNEEDRAAKMRDLDVRHFLRKPFAAEALLAALDEVINEKPARDN